jgi:hypothetical protein
VVRVEYERWNQKPEDLRTLALSSSQPRTRERFLALYEIANGSNATQVAARTGRCDEAVLKWVHTYNELGPEAVPYRHTGGHPPFAQTASKTSSKSSKTPSKRRSRRP